MASGKTGGGTGKKNRGIASDATLRLRVVLATFRHGGAPTYRSLRDVAAELNLTVPAVWALLQTAFAEDEFSIQVHLPREKSDVVRLEDSVKARYGLKKVVLVPGLPEILDDLDPPRRRNLHTQVIRSMAERVADHLDGLLAEAGAAQRAAAQAGREFEPLRIGVAWGRTMDLIAQYLLSNPRDQRLLGLEVLPIIGVTSTLRAAPVEANMVASNFARALGGRAQQLPCPAFLPARQADVVSQIRPVQRMLERIRVKCPIVITSMGPIPENVSATEITLSNDPVLNDQLFTAAREAGAIGEICYWLFARDGKEVTTGHTGIGLGFDGLRAVAKRGQVILVAGGDKRRFEPLKVALEAGLASVLISDTVTARYLVGELQADVAGGARVGETRSDA